MKEGITGREEDGAIQTDPYPYQFILEVTDTALIDVSLPSYLVEQVFAVAGDDHDDGVVGCRLASCNTLQCKRVTL